MQLTRIAAAALLLATGGQVLAGTSVQTATGIEVRPDAGPAKLVRLELMADNIVHVVKLDDAGKQLTPSLMTVAKPCACKFTVTNDKQTATLKAQKISAGVSLKDGQVRFFDAAGKPFLTEAA